MVRAAAGFVVRNGPTTNQDRWEENAGYTPFTLAAEIAGAAGRGRPRGTLRDRRHGRRHGGVPARHGGCLGSADRATGLYVTDTALAREAGVAGYYIRIAPPVAGEARAAPHATVEVRNRDICQRGRAGR